MVLIWLVSLPPFGLVCSPHLAHVLPSLRLEGEFFEVLELENFPFDKQDLAFIMAVKCAREGPCPLAFRIDPDVVRDVEGTRTLIAL